MIAQSIATEVGQRYEVTFDYGTFGNATRQSQELRFEALGGGGLITTQDYSVVTGTGFVTHTFGFVATNDFTELRISDLTTEANASRLDGVLDSLRIAETLFLEPEINNPGFEGQLTGYTVESGSAFEFRGGTVSEGGLALRLNSSNAPADLVLRQTLNTEVGTTYRIGFDLGIFGATNRTHEIRFEAIAGGEVLSSADYQKTGQDFTGQTFTFTATATTTDLRFSDLTTVSNGISSDLVLDNLSIDVLNRAPVAIAFSGADVDEGVAAGTGLGQFTTTDVDAGDTQTYTLISGDTDLLQIVGDELFTRDTFDFDTQPTLTTVVRSTDSQSATLDRTLTLQVNEVIDPFSTVGLNPATFNPSSTRFILADRTEPFVGTVADADPAVEVGSNALATGGDATGRTRVNPSGLLSITLSTVDPIRELVERLVKATTTTGFLPLSSPAEAASDPSPSSTTTSAAQPADPANPADSADPADAEALPQVQTLAAEALPRSTFNPWLVGLRSAHDGDNAADPVTAWLAWLDEQGPRDDDGSPPGFVDAGIQVTEVPTGP